MMKSVSLLVARTRFFLFAIALFATQTAVSAADETPVRALTPPAFPTEVYVALSDIEIFAIDERRQTFVIEADLQAGWLDPRLAYGVPGASGEPVAPQRYFEGAAEQLLETIWSPNFEILDGRGSRDRMQLAIDIDPNGSVFYWERFTAAIKQSLDLETFPFDAHEISFAFGAFGADANSVVFLPLEQSEPLIGWEPTEWVIENSELVVFPGYACSESGDPCVSADDCTAGESCEAGWASAQAHMSISRIPLHYLWKVILPLTLIVLASSAVFWLDLARFPNPGDRLAISFTGVLTVVAFDFVSSESLPKLWYSTVLDKVLIMAYVFLAINIALNVISTHLSTARPEASRRNDLIGRYVFPAAFLAGLWILFP